MPWKIERKHDHAVVTMNTNKVNAQNPAFFTDLHAAFDRLEAEFDDCAVVLTGTGKVFSAGLDLDHHFAMFARRNLKEIDEWFAAYRATNLRLFTYPRPTVAAINGHAYAGGFITAINCDYRIATEGALQFSLNEVPIGIKSHFTPTSSSWMNLVERFFADLTADVIRSGSFASIGELVRDIEAYLSDRNAAPKPYTWKAEGAAILEKINRARAALDKVEAA